MKLSDTFGISPEVAAKLADGSQTGERRPGGKPVGWGMVRAAIEESYQRQKQAEIAAAAEAAAVAAVREAIAPCEIDLDDVHRDGNEGFLYVLQFSTGAIKVGQTVELRHRLADHRRDAFAYNVAITDYWVSAAHVEYLANERHLIAYCRKIARRAKSEYFHGTDLPTVREFATGLPMTRSGRSDAPAA